MLLVTKNFDTIKGAILTVWEWIKEKWPLLLAILTGPIGLAVLAITSNWDKLKEAADRALRLGKGEDRSARGSDLGNRRRDQDGYRESRNRDQGSD